MSGGSMDYLSYKVEDAQFYSSTPERRAFKAHLKLVADALHKIEWNDSGDGADGESEAIRAYLNSGAVLEQATIDAQSALAELRAELDKAHLSESQMNLPGDNKQR